MLTYERKKSQNIIGSCFCRKGNIFSVLKDPYAVHAANEHFGGEIPYGFCHTGIDLSQKTEKMQ